MEKLLHYCWKHRLFPLRPLTTTDGRSVEVIDAGLPNRNAGPDFFNAKVKIDGTLWVGNVEIHDRAGDWYAHGHDGDSAYDNVVLHVCETIDTQANNSRGQKVAQMELHVPAEVTEHYNELLTTDEYPPCYRIIPTLQPLTVHAWMNALQTERLEQKTEAILQRVAKKNGDWEEGYFTTLARNFGFGINGDAFETWAQCVPLHAVAHHRDNLFQIEALFMGQAGLLDIASIPERHRDEALQDGYFTRLQKEYRYLAHKFALTPMDVKLWRFLRLRPQNFPHIRLAQLANLYHSRKAGLSRLVECETVVQLEDIFASHVTPYWETHYGFGSESGRKDKQISRTSLRLIILNTAIPVLFAYGRYKGDERLCDRAFVLLDELKAERNHIVRMWSEVGLPVNTAGDSQALVQLKREYCDRKDCLRCRFGFEYLKKAFPSTPLLQGGKTDTSTRQTK